ncbi:hypothetical protein [Halovivax sp.]|uniref:hypothetical protein n=1 Tax=Halovivax sp. TaxID=1935978 RepID=UPI0025C13E33|nr:hypothetical protein [Halovivax sp.]
MRLRYHRYKIVAGVLWSAGALLAGGHAVTRYERHQNRRFWHFEIVNESTEAVTLGVTVESDDTVLARTERLVPATDGESRREIHDR